MNMNNISTTLQKEGALPNIARCVHILLVVHNITALMFLASRFEGQQYKVTTAESASIALSLFRARKNYYDIVIADFNMPEMNIYEFLQKIQDQRMTIPIIVMAENPTEDLVIEAIGKGACYVFSKPPSHRDIVNTWQHIVRVTKKLPAVTDSTKEIDRKKYGSPTAGSSRDGAARKRNPRNIKRQIINTDEENNIDEDDCRNSKKSRMAWTFSLHEKFMQAIKSLGEHRVHPNSILRMMKEPGLTHEQVGSHLQKYRNRTRPDFNPQETPLPLMPHVMPCLPSSIFKQEQTSDTANVNYTTTHGGPLIPRFSSLLHAPKFVCYTLDDVKRKLDALNFPEDNHTKAINENGGFQVGEGSGGVQIAQGIDQGIDRYHQSILNGDTNIAEQAPLFLQSFGHVTMEGDHEIQKSDHMSNNLHASNVEPTGFQVAQGNEGVQIDQGIDQNHSNENANTDFGIQAPLVSQSFGGGIQASGNMTNGLQDPIYGPPGEFEMGMFGFENGGNLVNLNNDNFGEGTSGSNQQFSEISSNDDIGKIIQELEASGVDLWDLII